tara:strand:+ start:1499 stop:2881 length:1383 start_codon:yes stop_codon:yes gene_type:complete
MAKYSSYNGVSCTSITLVNDTTKGSINTINGLEYCTGGGGSASTAWSRMYVGLDDYDLSWAASGSVSSKSAWYADTSDIRKPFGPFAGSGKAISEIAYGKDGSGNPMWVLKTGADTQSLHRITDANFVSGSRGVGSNQISFRQWADPTGSAFTSSARPQTQVKQLTVAWGNNVWMSIGDLKTKKYIFRSVDGATWDPVIIDTLSEMPTGNRSCTALTTDGNGNWWFGVVDKLYKSSDNGLTWSLQCTFDITFGAYTNGNIQDLVYTNDTLVCLYRKGDSDPADGRIHARAAPGSNTSTFASSDGEAGWGTEVLLSGAGVGRYPDASGSPIMNAASTNKAVAANGRVAFHDTETMMFADVDGSASALADRLIIVTPRTDVGNGEHVNGNLNDVGTDGEGNWYVSADGDPKGSICENQFNGAHTGSGGSAGWVKVINGFPDDTDGTGNTKVHCFAINRYLPI